MNCNTVSYDQSRSNRADESPPGAILTAARQACTELGLNEEYTGVVLRVPTSAGPDEPISPEVREALFDLLLIRLGVERLMPGASTEDRRAWIFRQGALGITRNSPLFFMGAGPEFVRKVRDSVWRNIAAGGDRG